MNTIDKVAWVCIKDRKVLFVRSKGKDAFYNPGGKREGAESDSEALIREIKFGLVLIPAASCSLGRSRRGTRPYRSGTFGRVRRDTMANFVVEELAPPTHLLFCGFIPEASLRVFSAITIKEEVSVDLLPETITYLETFTAQAHGKPLGTLVQIKCYTADFVGDLRPNSEIEELAWLTSNDVARTSPTGRLTLVWLKQKNLIE